MLSSCLLLGGVHLPGDGTPTAVESSRLDLAGLWEVRWAQAIRNNRDGTVDIQRWGDAILDLSVEGESVTGTWTTEVVERVVWQVAGSYDGTALRLEGTEHDSANEELSIVDRISFRAALDGQELEGVVRVHIRGRDREPADRPFSGRRAGS